MALPASDASPIAVMLRRIYRSIVIFSLHSSPTRSTRPCDYEYSTFLVAIIPVTIPRESHAGVITWACEHCCQHCGAHRGGRPPPRLAQTCGGPHSLRFTAAGQALSGARFAAART